MIDKQYTAANGKAVYCSDCCYSEFPCLEYGREGCHAPAVTRHKKRWWGIEEIGIGNMRKLNKNNDCPYFKWGVTP
jgi:hypothetical protein